MDTIKQLADEIPYRQFLKESIMNLRDDGILKGYWADGPSPDSSDAGDLPSASRTARQIAPVHLRTGDAIQVVFDRQPRTPAPA